MLKQLFERAYGKNFYQHIGEYLLSSEDEGFQYDIRIFHFLYEHKLMMKNRICYLLNTSRITDKTLLNDWDNIMKEASKIRNKVIKLNLLCRHGYQELNDRIQILGINERVVLENTIHHVKNCISHTTR